MTPRQELLTSTVEHLARWEACTVVRLEQLGWDGSAIAEILCDYRASLVGVGRLVAEQNERGERCLARALALATAISRALDASSPPPALN